MGTYMKKKVEHLVVDTSAFIKNASVHEIGENVLTVQGVIEEIKSKRQLRRLVVLPYDLTVKEPFPENIKFVTDFAKKTGDLTSLSAIDINVIALTYQLEKEKKGTDHLKTEPLHKPTIEAKSSIPEDLKNIAGFHLPKSKIGDSKSQHKNSDEDLSEYESAEDEKFDSAEEDEVESKNKKPNNSVVLNEEEKYTAKVNGFKVKESGEEEGESDADFEENDLKCNEEEDDDGWITPGNIVKVKHQLASELDDDLENVSVACLTTDFAMQNVLKQIGLHVVSLDGKLIKQLRTFILRCYGCFKTTSVMSKVFCPNCGNKTLKKVAVSVDAEGNQQIHINFRKPLTARGKKFSLPLPKGGKHSNNPILCEDQPMPQQRPSRLSRTKNNPLDDDYIAGYSPFATRDVYSKSAMLGIKPHLEVKHWMRRNPNESRKNKK